MSVEDIHTSLHETLPDMMANTLLTGLSLAVIRDGEVVLSEGFGKRRSGSDEAGGVGTRGSFLQPDVSEGSSQLAVRVRRCRERYALQKTSTK
jgi:hypothetical protein